MVRGGVLCDKACLQHATSGSENTLQLEPNLIRHYKKNIINFRYSQSYGVAHDLGAFVKGRVARPSISKANPIYATGAVQSAREVVTSVG